MNASEKIASAYLRLNGFFTLPLFTTFFQTGRYSHFDIAALRKGDSNELVNEMPCLIDQEFFDEISKLIPTEDPRLVDLAVAAEVRSNETKDAPTDEQLKYLSEFCGGLKPISLSFRLSNDLVVIEDGQVAVVSLQHCIGWIIERIEWMGSQLDINKPASWNWSEPFLADLLVLYKNGHLKP